MTFIARAALVLTVPSVLLFTSSAQAAATVFTTEAAFLAAIAPGYYTENFNSTDPPNYAANGFSYAVSATGGPNPPLYDQGTFIGTNYPAQTFTFAFTSGNVQAVGGNFFLTSQTNVFQALPVTLTFSEGTSLTYTPASVATYRGFVFTAPVTSLVMSAPGATSYNSVDNITVALAPEPGRALLLSCGLAVACTRRRRSKK